jgi:hypothetical protein
MKLRPPSSRLQRLGEIFYDICIDDDKTGFLVCDIAGRGISAALLAVEEIRTKIKTELEQGDNPGWLCNTNRNIALT